MWHIHCSSVGRARTVTDEGQGSNPVLLLTYLSWELMVKDIFIAEIIVEKQGINKITFSTI